ncbi:MAG: ABC transporter substrate-binding protein [Rhodospirillales bacterium]|nr:ABC transporter substrate-binding protein [Rhodospirillales bacterium]
MSRKRHGWATVLLLVCMHLAAGGAVAGDKIVLGTDWRAQAEHGGFYQALATGLYAKYGLDVVIRQGGPQVNAIQLLAAGRLDAAIAPNSFLSLNAVRENIPLIAVAAIFQKDPAVLIAHPGQGNDSFEALKGKPIMIGADTRAGSWLFLKQRFGYSDAQIRPYVFSIAPFLVDPHAVQQGYAGSEPYLIHQQGIEPVVLLLADAGYASYGSLIEVSTQMVRERSDLVQRFVDASIEGWQSYLDGDPSPGNALILKDNPEMTPDLIAYGIAQMKRWGIVSSGDAERLGIGVMSEARWQAFFTTMASAGLYPPAMDWHRAFTLHFVTQREDLESGGQ